MTLNEKQKAELDMLNNMPDEEIDFSDIPETLDWSKGIRGGFYQLAAMERPTGPTDTTEKGLENLICAALTSRGWLPGDPQDYERTHCVDLRHLSEFLTTTQPETTAVLSLDTDSPTRRQFLSRVKQQIGNRGSSTSSGKASSTVRTTSPCSTAPPPRATPQPNSATNRTDSP